MWGDRVTDAATDHRDPECESFIISEVSDELLRLTHLVSLRLSISDPFLRQAALPGK